MSFLTLRRGLRGSKRGRRARKMDGFFQVGSRPNFYILYIFVPRGPDLQMSVVGEFPNIITLFSFGFQLSVVYGPWSIFYEVNT